MRWGLALLNEDSSEAIPDIYARNECYEPDAGCSGITAWTAGTGHLEFVGCLALHLISTSNVPPRLDSKRNTLWHTLQDCMAI